MKKLIALTALLLTDNSFANDFEAYKSGFKTYKNQQLQAYADFKNERDRQFSEFLKSRWQAFEGEHIKPRVTLPIELPGNDEDFAQQLKQYDDILNAPISADVEPDLDFDSNIEELLNQQDQAFEEVAELEPLNTEITSIAVAAKATLNDLPKNIDSEDKISKSWDVLAVTDYQPIVDALKKVQKTKKLSDWFMLELIETKVSSDVADESQIAVVTWFYLLQMGYDVKIGLVSKQPGLMFHSKHDIYDQPFYLMDKKRYYQRNRNLKGGVVTYLQNFDDGVKPLKLDFAKGTQWSSQYKSVSTKGINVEVDLKYINYLKGHPKVELEHYFNAPLNPQTISALKKYWQPKLAGKSDYEKVSLLLRWVHKQFPHGSDEEQFGFKNYLTVEETVFYKASDCEDRSILMANLVKLFTDLDVVILSYQTHVAIGVELESLPDSLYDRKQYAYEGKVYTVVDPSMVGSVVGREATKIPLDDMKIIKL
ncbi:hypothetical protein [Paraferrimonas sp. SM1919]|uniref:hypothetical protein n=1 Tax=Paraferrimonas sp. SM1919 TaxID=2662263 RepID=UPI0013D6FEAF|nr:hypothetical protein [Paraferrimonas sp. SM1919]